MIRTLPALFRRLGYRGSLEDTLRAYGGKDWTRARGPWSVVLHDDGAARVRLLCWAPGTVLDFHDHPGFDRVGLRHLAGAPLVEERLDPAATRVLRVGDASELAGHERHRVTAVGATTTLQVDLRW